MTFFRTKLHFFEIKVYFVGIKMSDRQMLNVRDVGLKMHFFGLNCGAWRDATLQAVGFKKKTTHS
jgi:hypothetical protein